MSRKEIIKAYLKYFGVSSVKEANELVKHQTSNRLSAYKNWVQIRS